MSKKSSKAVGIDLGTTYTCVSVFRNGQCEIIPNIDGDRTIDSIVAYFKNEPVYGNLARATLNNCFESGAANPKRFIGRGFDEPEVIKAREMFGSNLVRKNHSTVVDETARDNIWYMVKKDKDQKDVPPVPFTPIELSASILKHVKSYSEKYLGHEITEAVITVPAHFNDNQRFTTKCAAEIAGFKTVRLLNEPTAAAMAWGYSNMNNSSTSSEEKNLFVFDLGGGTFDVSFLKFGDKLDEGSSIAQVIDTDGDVFLGGLDFDRVLVDIVTEAWLKKNPGCFFQDKHKRKLLTVCERAKRVLASAQVAMVEIEFYEGVETFVHPVTLAQFQVRSKHLVKRCMERVKSCLLRIGKNDGSGKSSNHTFDDQGNLIGLTENDKEIIRKTANSIDKVLCVGGSTRLLAIQKALHDFFGKSKVSCEVHPDEIVAMGASYYAAMLAGDSDMSQEQMICLLDAISFSLGIETQGGVMSDVITQGTTIPCRKSQIFTTAADNQSAVTIAIYEGDSKLVCNNNLLGTFVLPGIPPAPKGIPQIEVTMEVGSDGILKVTAVEKGSNKKEEMVVQALGKYTPEEIEAMKKRFKEHEAEDNMVKEKIEAGIELEGQIYTMTAAISELKIDQAAKDKITAKIDEISNWLTINKKTATKDEIKNKQKELQEIVSKATASAQQNQDNSGATVEEVD